MTDRDLDVLVDALDLDLDMAVILGTHIMAPDHRHTMCGFDLIPAGLRTFPDFLTRTADCPPCLDVLGAIG